MKLGIAIDFHGQPGFPTWQSIRQQALLAEEMGFDVVVIPDHLLYPQEEGPSIGCWESVSMAGALAEATSSIKIGHSMFNAPYRSPAMVAKIAETLDEISGGRYVFGLGAGNTPDADYRAFGIAANDRFSRFAEAIHIIHDMLKQGRVNFNGQYWSAQESEMVLRGPRPGGLPIMIAAHGPKMMRLAAEYADAWNGWVMKPSFNAFRTMLEELERACEEFDRDPVTIRRTLDVNIDHTGYFAEHRSGGSMEPLSGADGKIADEILSYSELGVEEVRCYYYAENSADNKRKAIDAMSGILERVHQG